MYNLLTQDICLTEVHCPWSRLNLTQMRGLLQKMLVSDFSIVVESLYSNAHGLLLTLLRGFTPDNDLGNIKIGREQGCKMCTSQDVVFEWESEISSEVTKIWVELQNCNDTSDHFPAQYASNVHNRSLSLVLWYSFSYHS